MNKFVVSVLFAFFPILVFADNSSLSFTPPASDYSMVFLGNLFGVVDGVLNGTGSQIMGAMFSVFNSAVLALGGIIIMYTLIVSTMNTAHEGQMLGQKWSSIWIPVRSTAGLALLIPKASGYCLMQIFVMWVVAQGVGAADKVWDAALSYLARGGAIIKAQSNPAQPLIDAVSGKPTAVPQGAMTILVGQVCMLGIQKQLETKREVLLALKNKGSGSCSGGGDASAQEKMRTLCTAVVPDFLGSVNFIAAQDTPLSKGNTEYAMSMPNFDSTSPYSRLNGVCGVVRWKSVKAIDPKLTSTVTLQSKTQIDVDLSKANPFSGNWAKSNEVAFTYQLTPSEIHALTQSRAVALQQMYLNLSAVAQAMVDNDPVLNKKSDMGVSDGLAFSPGIAQEQFGVPYDEDGNVCVAGKDCIGWGPVPSSSGSGNTLFNGGEFFGAISAYNAVMLPTLKLLDDISKGNVDAASREFIKKARAQGWIMAGSYFFNLVKLSGKSSDNLQPGESGKSGANIQDNDSSLDTSTPPEHLSDVCEQGANYNSNLCNWIGRDGIQSVVALIDGSQTVGVSKVDKPDLSPGPGVEVAGERRQKTQLISGKESSTVFGYIKNAMSITLPGQPGLAPLTFAKFVMFNVDASAYRLERQNFECGRVTTFIFKFCLGNLLGNIFYNMMFYPIYNILLTWFMTIINVVVMGFVQVPVQAMAVIFKHGLEVLSEPGVNPVVALANMGVMYINFSGNLWITLMAMSVTSALIPVFGLFIFALSTFAMPLLLAWLGIMVSVGFTTAYYIPILPYMIFTFGSIAWLISVIEAMVAAPIIALGVTHPEGHDAFGKGEAAVMLLMNVFLRPSMMIIGYIFGIALCYVGVWILNAGFDNAIGFIQSGDELNIQKGSGTGEYKDWAGVYAYFFGILIYTTIYLTIVQKAFTLIAYLPDKVLRWIGGTPESLGSDASQWGDENVKGKLGEAGKGTQDAQGQMDKQLGAGAAEKAAKGADWLKSKTSKLTSSGSVDLE